MAPVKPAQSLAHSDPPISVDSCDNLLAASVDTTGTGVGSFLRSDRDAAVHDGRPMKKSQSSVRGFLNGTPPDRAALSRIGRQPCRRTKSIRSVGDGHREPTGRLNALLMGCLATAVSLGSCDSRTDTCVAGSPKCPVSGVPTVIRIVPSDSATTFNTGPVAARN